MSAAAAAAAPADAGAAAPSTKGKKKLLIMLVVGVLAFALAGGGAVFMMKKKAAAAQAAEDGDEAVASAEHKAEKPDLKHPPTFLPLDPFVVNLSDKDADRYAQIGITFEVADAKFGELLKAYMPAIRNSILMILAQKSSADLLDRPGKEQLAGQIQREAARVMGIDVEEPEAPAAKAPAKDEAKAKDGVDEEKPKAKKRKTDAEPNPIRHVHFSNFIIQ
jgi:flagellar FliL protein